MVLEPVCLSVYKILRRQSDTTHFIHRVACASTRVDSTVIYRNTGSPGCQQVRVRCGVWDSETFQCQRSPCQVKVIDSTKWPIRNHCFMYYKLIYASYPAHIIRWNNQIGFPLLFVKNFELPGKCPMKLAFLYEPYGYLEKITLVFAPMSIQYIVQIGVFKWKIRKCNHKHAW